MRDNAGPGRFSFLLGADGQANLVTVFSERCSGGGIFLQLVQQISQVILDRSVFFGQSLELSLEMVGVKNLKVHPAADRQT